MESADGENGVTKTVTYSAQFVNGMNIIDRYILKKVLSTFFFVVLILMAIITIIDVTEKMDKFSKNNLDAYTVLGYYLDFIPWIAGLVTPITIFIAIIYVTSRMAGHTEIIAILSSGVSFRRMLLPYFVASLVVGSISFALNGWVIPRATKSRLAFELQYFNNRYYFDARNIHLQVAPQVYLFIQNYNNVSNMGYQFSLERFDKNILIEKLTADNILWDTVKHKWTLKFWKLKRIDDIFAASQTGDPSQLMSSGATMDTTLAISPKDFEAQERSYEGMTTPELYDHIDKLKFRGASGVQMYEVDKQIRFAAPFTTFILVFMGVTVSSRKSRGGTGLQIAVGFVLAFVFILFFLLTRSFAETGSMHPIIAAWTPNIIFAAISTVLFRYTPQ
ncbi:MAG: LptF/LptG family permease [Cytophagales bacterium]|nr:LptF/LptG family permease [Cytophagales bacterium]